MVNQYLGPPRVQAPIWWVAKLVARHIDALAVLAAVRYLVFKNWVKFQIFAIWATRAYVSLAHGNENFAWGRWLPNERGFSSRFFQRHRTGNSKTICHSKCLLCILGLFSKFFPPKNVQKGHNLHKVLKWGAQKIKEIFEQRIVILNITPPSSP